MELTDMEHVELALLRTSAKYEAFKTTDHANHIAHQLVASALRDVADTIRELRTES